jgi:UDP-N-acetylglucosamine diphosphorylase / glucose-1-phosphate thymidylyltransferase / UDP-N-acetylgalactosamine diphosphorylase / glucosamine-1-phosphate N-acetyltransferase / galactosamine-1-phosphate N-acetyltransferase
MKVLLLAGGRSTRMRPIEDKNFLNFLGKPLIQYQLEMLKLHGFEDVVVVGRDNGEKIAEVGDALGMRVEVARQDDEKGMCGAVLAAGDLLGDEAVLIVSSNDVVDASAYELMREAYQPGDAESYLLGKKVERYFPGGYLEVDGEGHISNIVEKPGEGNEPSDLVNLVIHLHKDPQRLIKYLEEAKSDSDDLYEVALANMIGDGLTMKAVSYDGFWQPIKFPWHIDEVFRHFFALAEKGVADSAQIDERAVVDGDVIIGENVRIFAGAIVKGPCYLGAGTVVASNALVRDSHLGSACVIGYSTEVARSYLGNDVWTHSNYIGDSVIGSNVSFGAGAVTGNLRLDEGEVIVKGDGREFTTGKSKFGAIIGSNVRVGVNTSIMPGVKIFEDCFIGAGIVVPHNIEPESFVRGDWKLKISENRSKMGEMDRAEFKKKL